jgi:hypothetical protein
MTLPISFSAFPRQPQNAMAFQPIIYVRPAMTFLEVMIGEFQTI